MAKAKTLIVEGVNGSGKTTAVQHAVGRLRADGLRVTVVSDPGGTVLGDALRVLLGVDDHQPISAPYSGTLAKFLLYQAARVQVEEEIVLPALEDSDLIVFDRWVPSTEVYQYRLAGVEAGLVAGVVESTCRVLQGDVALYLRVNADKAYDRLKSRGVTDLNKPRIVSEVQAYDEMVKSQGGWQGDHWHPLDANHKLPDVVKAIVDIGYGLVSRGIFR